jgi:integrase
MAHIRKRGKSYRVEIQLSGRPRESKSFDTRAAAAKWALQREAELDGKELPHHTVRDALNEFAAKVAPKRPGAKWEIVRLASAKRSAWGGIEEVALPRLAAADVARWRDRRLVDVKPGSVAREMNLLRAVLKVARTEWGWISHDPMAGVAPPKEPPPRRRRVSVEEINAICEALGYSFPSPPAMKSHYVALAFLLSLETAMRSSEILAIRPSSAFLDERYLQLEKSKNGDPRQVPLTKRAVEILRVTACQFPVDAESRDTLFRRARDAAKISNLHFHDARAEAIWRLSKKLDVLQLARMIGHRDIKSIMFYYNEPAEDTAKQLD